MPLSLWSHLCRQQLTLWHHHFHASRFDLRPMLPWELKVQSLLTYMVVVPPLPNKTRPSERQNERRGWNNSQKLIVTLNTSDKQKTFKSSEKDPLNRHLMENENAYETITSISTKKNKKHHAAHKSWFYHPHIWGYIKHESSLQEEVRVHQQKMEGAEAYSQHLLALLQTHYLQKPSLYKSKA